MLHGENIGKPPPLLNNGGNASISTNDWNTSLMKNNEALDLDFEAPFLPHSELSVFGVDNASQYWEHYVQSNFHARLLHNLNPNLLHFPNLDSYL